MTTFGLAAASVAAQPRLPPIDMAGLLARVGEQVEQYFARAASVICKEAVRIQALGADLLGDGSRPRQLVYDLRIAWEPTAGGDGSPEVNVVRDIRTVNGRPPRPNDDNGCMDPKPVSPEPLAMLLPSRQDDFAFSWAGFGRIDGRAAAMIDYRSLESGPVSVTRREDCVSIDLPGRNRGRVWIDQQTGEVLRLDERLTGMFDVDIPMDPKRRFETRGRWMIERAETSIRYKRVRFQDPEEDLMLPASIESLQIIRDAGVPRVRTSQMFSEYRRFLTGGRVVQ
jgi:hypothetical protein